MQCDKLAFERDCFTTGVRLVAGVDEVGMGCLAGPVVAGAVILDFNNIPDGIDDSKLVTPRRREILCQNIRSSALGLAIGVASVEEIDSLNIYQAARLAMRRAVEQLTLRPEILLIDGRVRIDTPLKQRSIIRGDRLSVSIGAASIVAKVYRDHLMREMEAQYPGYGFAQHKGYGSRAHRQYLQIAGPCPIHRKTFTWKPV